MWQASSAWFFSSERTYCDVPMHVFYFVSSFKVGGEDTWKTSSFGNELSARTRSILANILETSDERRQIFPFTARAYVRYRAYRIRVPVGTSM